MIYSQLIHYLKHAIYPVQIQTVSDHTDKAGKTKIVLTVVFTLMLPLDQTDGAQNSKN